MEGNWSAMGTKNKTKKGKNMKNLLIFMWLVAVCGVANAQTETTKWYIDGKVYTTTNCESGGDIEVPELPERFGYTFQGWMPAVYDMSTIDTSINGTSSSTSGKTWRAIFSYGAVYGESLCSPTSNSEWYTNTVLDTETGSGQYCYCRVTEFIPTGSSIVYEPVSSLWAFNGDYFSASDCALRCPDRCGSGFRTNPALRAGLLGSVAQ